MTIEFNRKRLEARHIAQGPVAQQALAVSRADREGEVDGVLVDFRHPDIPPGEFEARAWWYVSYDSETHAGILLDCEAAAIEKILADPIEMAKRERFRRRELRESLALPKATKGDRLTVESVLPVIGLGPFDHKHDKTIKRANLLLTRANGEVVQLPTPLDFFGITQLHFGPQRDAYDRLVERILMRHKEGANPLEYDLTGGKLFLEDRTLENQSENALEEAEIILAKLRDLGLLEGRTGSLIRDLVSEVAIMAFFQGKSELRDAERRAAAQLANLAEGAKTKTNWDRVAEANRLALENPDWSRTRIASHIARAESKGADDPVVAFGSVKRSVQRMLKVRNIGPEPKG